MAVLKEPSVWLEIFMQMYMNQEKCIAQIAQRFLVDRLIKLENCDVFLLRETRPTPVSSVAVCSRFPDVTHCVTSRKTAAGGRCWVDKIYTYWAV